MFSSDFYRHKMKVIYIHTSRYTCKIEIHLNEWFRFPQDSSPYPTHLFILSLASPPLQIKQIPQAEAQPTQVGRAGEWLASQLNYSDLQTLSSRAHSVVWPAPSHHQLGRWSLPPTLLEFLCSGAGPRSWPGGRDLPIGYTISTKSHIGFCHPKT